MKVQIASDHAGFRLKNRILRFLTEKKMNSVDMGTDDDGSVDYPDYAVKVAESVSKGDTDRGILICGTGI